MENELAIARRLLKQMDVLTALPETPAGSRAVMREAGVCLEALCDLEQPVNIKVVSAMVTRLNIQKHNENQSGARATLRRLERVLAAVTDARTIGWNGCTACANRSAAAK